MKKILFTLIISVCVLNAFGQQMQVKVPNFKSFRKDAKLLTPTLAKSSSAEAKQHPEYGIVPFNTQCNNCVELVDKRTVDSRLFIDANNSGHFYSQKSYLPLHYKQSENDIWRTIDPRLHPDEANPGVYIAEHQPVPAKCDLNRKTTSLTERGTEFEFNRNLSLYFFNDKVAYTKAEEGNYTNATIGEEGLLVKNMWPGIDMQQVFTEGTVETNYIINATPKLPITDGWMVVEDHFTLPEGVTIEESKDGEHLENGYYRGDYILKDKNGFTLFTYEKPIYIDTKAFGMHGMYKLIQEGNNCTLQTMIPLSWINRADNTYPLYIDPYVLGQTKEGEFTSQGTSSYFQYAFTTMDLGSCNYQLTVDVPGASKLTSAYVDLEYQLTYDNACGNPPLPAPFCTFSQIYQRVLCDSCQTISPTFQCNPAQPPFTGTCTTDSNLVPGAHSINITNLVPDFLACYTPQCTYYQIPFTLENQDSTCGDVCGYLCARGHVWIMTVEGERESGNISLISDTVCPGQSVTLTCVDADTVLPPYQYQWFQYLSNTNSVLPLDSISGSNQLTLNVDSDITVFCNIYSNCPDSDGIGGTNYVTIYTVQPVITVTGDTLLAPTGSAYQWYLNDTLITNATQQQYIATQPGTYSVVIPSDTGCQPGPITIQPTGIYTTTIVQNKISVLPNPSDGSFILRFTSAENIQNAALRIFDDEGRIIFSSNIGVVTGTNDYPFQAERKIAGGMYWVEMQTPSKIYTQKILIGL